MGSLTFNRDDNKADHNNGELGRFACNEDPTIQLVYIDLNDDDFGYGVVAAQLAIGDLNIHLVNYGQCVDPADWYFDDDHSDASEEDSLVLVWERDVRIANSVYERLTARFSKEN